MPSGLWHFALSVGVCSLADNNNNNNNMVKGYHASFKHIFLLAGVDLAFIISRMFCSFEKFCSPHEFGYQTGICL